MKIMIHLNRYRVLDLIDNQLITPWRLNSIILHGLGFGSRVDTRYVSNHQIHVFSISSSQGREITQNNDSLVYQFIYLDAWYLQGAQRHFIHNTGVLCLVSTVQNMLVRFQLNILDTYLIPLFQSPRCFTHGRVHSIRDIARPKQ